VCMNAGIYVQHGCGIAGDLALQASGSNVARILAGMYVCMCVSMYACAIHVCVMRLCIFSGHGAGVSMHTHTHIHIHIHIHTHTQ
jgi:hypothetical protein